jgi:hypothetical protein
LSDELARDTPRQSDAVQRVSMLNLSALSTAFFGLLVAAPPAPAGAPAQHAAAVVTAQAPAPERPGLTVSLGFGYGYGLYGVQLRYDRPLRPWLHLAPFVAGGVNFDLGWKSVVGAVGLSSGLGWHHRLTVDVAIAPTTWEQLDVHGSRLDSRNIYGPVVAAGWEHVSERGYLQRITLGRGWGRWAKGAGPFPPAFMLAIGFGWRAW